MVRHGGQCCVPDACGAEQFQGGELIQVFNSGTKVSTEYTNALKFWIILRKLRSSIFEQSGSILFDHIRFVPGWSDQLIVIIVLK